MHIASIGVDLGKTTFHLVALGEQGKVVVRKKFSRKQLLAYTANLKNSLVGIEACSGAHFIGAALRSQGHDVRLIPAQFVKPYVKSNKNDFLDAEAIAEAVTRQNMRFVPIKTGDQLDLQALHRVRDRLVHRHTAIINQIRGGITHVFVEFDGAGDSGQIEGLCARINDSPIDLPVATVSLHTTSLNQAGLSLEETSLTAAIEDVCYGFLEQTHAGWENNDGAYGEFTFDVVERKITLDFNGVSRTRGPTLIRFDGGDHGTSVSSFALQREQMGRLR